MKINPHPPNLGRDEMLIETLRNLFEDHKMRRPQAVIECGTFLGTGTTALVIEALTSSKWNHTRGKFPSVYTIEADKGNHKQAVKNLPRWVKCIHGCSVDIAEAVEFILNDEVLLHHNEYPDIYYDSNDPVNFYVNEITGQLPEFGGDGDTGENFVLKRLINFNEKKLPLFVLDSAGGIGFFEYQKVLELMKKKRFYVWCHDINHLKHFRSYQHMQEAENCNIMTVKENEWVLSQFNFRKGKNG